jgi:AcrR family transcriptional regulator
MSQATPRAKRQQRTYEAILAAARQLIHEQGINGLSIRAIAERVEYSPAAIYEYFGSKEEIITGICIQGHQRLHDYMARVAADLPFSEYLLRIGLAYLEFAIQNPDFFLLMFTTAPVSEDSFKPVAMGPDQAADCEGSSFAVLVGAIERGVNEGILQVRPGMGVLEMALAAWSTVHGLAMLRITQLKAVPLDFDTLARETLSAFGTGLALNSQNTTK